VSGGPVWGAASEDLNATILVWPPGDGPPVHVNAERDVLYVVLAGSARLDVDGDVSELAAGAVAIVEKGRSRALTAGPDGVRYLTTHVRRSALQIRPLSAPADPRP
jgi:quercetin dioxygenase-like cupin family protein